MVWTPLLEGEQQQRALAAVDLIAARLCARPFTDERLLACGLMRGQLGEALFLSYYAKARDDEAAAARATELLERAFERVSEISDEPRLYAGFAGTGWAIEHLRDKGMLDVEPDVDDAIDDALLMLLDAKPDWLGFEWLAGASGWGVYALERRPWGRDLLDRIVSELARHAEHDAIGVRWRSTMPIAERFPKGCYPLDPAHGALGPIGVLSGCAAQGVDGARDLVSGSVAALLANRFTSSTGPAFRQYAGEDEGGLAWCRGDAGAAGVLSTVAVRLAESAWADVAIDAARRVAANLGFLRALDAGGLCHGVAGAAHIVHRVGRRHDDRVLVDAARPAFLRVIDATRWTPDDDASFLTGQAGIGLAILAACTAGEPDWDRVLLLSDRAPVS